MTQNEDKPMSHRRPSETPRCTCKWNVRDRPPYITKHDPNCQYHTFGQWRKFHPDELRQKLLAMAENYNGEDDFGRSIDECYRVIRERVAKGGKGWRPK